MLTQIGNDVLRTSPLQGFSHDPGQYHKSKLHWKFYYANAKIPTHCAKIMPQQKYHTTWLVMNE